MPHPHWMDRVRTRRGFTLIELLVVIAIIALLLSILVPSLQQARELARQTVCMTQLKSQGTGVALYAETYNGLIPPAGANADCYWVGFYRYLVANWPLNNVPWPANPRGWRADKSFVGSRNIFKCPSAKQVDAWGDDIPCQYGMNARMGTTEAALGAAAKGYIVPVDPAQPNGAQHYNLWKTIAPSKVYLLADSTDGRYIDRPNASSIGYMDYRHMKKLSMIYHDGHQQQFDQVVDSYTTWGKQPWFNSAQ